MGKRSTTKASRNIKPKKNNTWLVLGGAVFLVGIVWAAVHLTNTSAADKFQPDKAPVTLIATLNPEDFAGKARAAYQAAKEIPEVLSQLPCFCGCMDSLKHKSNLYCFADNHGNICDMCQNIALEAQEMHRKGTPVSQIRDKIRAAYSDQRM
jgi:hypothetical protein